MCRAVYTGEPVKTERPPGVPDHALWVGGADGGVFITITGSNGNEPNPDKAEKAENPDNHARQMTIFYDDGEIWHQTATDLTRDDLSRMSGWDGTTLYFQDGRKQVLIR